MPIVTHVVIVLTQLLGAMQRPSDQVAITLQVEDSGYCREGAETILGLHVRLVFRNNSSERWIISRVIRPTEIRWESLGSGKGAKRFDPEGLLDPLYLSATPPRRDLFDMILPREVSDAVTVVLRLPVKKEMSGTDLKISVDFQMFPGDLEEAKQLRQKWRSYGRLLLDTPMADQINFRIPRAPYVRPSCLVTLAHPELYIHGPAPR